MSGPRITHGFKLKHRQLNRRIHLRLFRSVMYWWKPRRNCVQSYCTFLDYMVARRVLKSIESYLHGATVTEGSPCCAWESCQWARLGRIGRPLNETPHITGHVCRLAPIQRAWKPLAFFRCLSSHPKYILIRKLNNLDILLLLHWKAKAEINPKIGRS